MKSLGNKTRHHTESDCFLAPMRASLIKARHVALLIRSSHRLKPPPNILHSLWLETNLRVVFKPLLTNRNGEPSSAVERSSDRRRADVVAARVRPHRAEGVIFNDKNASRFPWRRGAWSVLTEEGCSDSVVAAHPIWASNKTLISSDWRENFTLSAAFFFFFWLFFWSFILLTLRFWTRGFNELSVRQEFLNTICN